MHCFIYTELLIYLAIGSCLNLTIAQCNVNEKSTIDLQKSNDTPYKNKEQEWMKLLVEQYNLHEKNDFPYQMYYIYR